METYAENYSKSVQLTCSKHQFLHILLPGTAYGMATPEALVSNCVLEVFPLCPYKDNELVHFLLFIFLRASLNFTTVSFLFT